MTPTARSSQSSDISKSLEAVIGRISPTFFRHHCLITMRETMIAQEDCPGDHCRHGWTDLIDALPSMKFRKGAVEIDSDPAGGSSIFYLLSSIFYLLSSIFYLLSSIFYLLSSILFLLSSFFYPLSSFCFIISRYFQCFSMRARDGIDPESRGDYFTRKPGK